MQIHMVPYSVVSLLSGTMGRTYFIGDNTMLFIGSTLPPSPACCVVTISEISKMAHPVEKPSPRCTEEYIYNVGHSF
jgi:hypothetical protein